jgi:signal transduction histidine kinase
MRKKGGVLRISLSNVDIRENGLKPDIEMAPGSYVKVSVQDTGTGMADKVRRRIFEPFFTTKGVGLGTGMGLAVVYGIVKSHKGAITFDTEPDKGTTFNVFLPLVKTRVTQERDVIGLAGVPNERYSDKR